MRFIRGYQLGLGLPREQVYNQTMYEKKLTYERASASELDEGSGRGDKTSTVVVLALGVYKTLISAQIFPMKLRPPAGNLPGVVRRPR